MRYAVFILTILLAPAAVAQDEKKAPPAGNPRVVAAPGGPEAVKAPAQASRGARRGWLVVALLVLGTVILAVLGARLLFRQNERETQSWAVRAAEIAGVLVGMGILIGGAVWWMARTPPAEPVPSILDQPFGAYPVLGIEDDGFYGPEKSTTPFRWTNGKAKLVVPLHGPAPKAMYVRVILPGRPDYRVCIKANGQTLLDEGIDKQGSWARTFDLSGMDLGKTLTLELISDTFVPALTSNKSNDHRMLGLRVAEIMLLSSRTKGYTDMPLGVLVEQEVAEAGFYRPEVRSGQPSRWTNGAARLKVPLGSKAPRSLALSLEIPPQPNYRVKVTINGHVLFDDMVKSNSVWSTELPLTDVPLGELADIELDSSTFVPADVGINPNDRRPLGVNVRRLVLVTGT